MGRQHCHRRARSADARTGHLELACRVLLRAARPTVDARSLRVARDVAIRLMAQAGVDLSRLDALLPVEMEAGDLAAWAMGGDGAVPASTGAFAAPVCIGEHGPRFELRCMECGALLIRYAADAFEVPGAAVITARVSREVREWHTRMCPAG